MLHCAVAMVRIHPRARVAILGAGVAHITAVSAAAPRICDSLSTNPTGRPDETAAKRRHPAASSLRTVSAHSVCGHGERFVLIPSNNQRGTRSVVARRRAHRTRDAKDPDLHRVEWWRRATCANVGAGAPRVAQFLRLKRVARSTCRARRPRSAWVAWPHKRQLQRRHRLGQRSPRARLPS